MPRIFIGPGSACHITGVIDTHASVVIRNEEIKTAVCLIRLVG